MPKACPYINSIMTQPRKEGGVINCTYPFAGSLKFMTTHSLESYLGKLE